MDSICLYDGFGTPPHRSKCHWVSSNTTRHCSRQNKDKWTGPEFLPHDVHGTCKLKKDSEARRHIVKEVMNLQLQVHDLAARLALKAKMIETEVLPVAERMEVFGRMAQMYAALNAKALENYRAAIDGVNKASWEDLTKMAEEAPSRRAELEGVIRHLQGGVDRQEAESED